MAVKKTQLYASLWASCDKLRGGMDSSEYKDYILTLLFMKYVTDKFKNKGAYEDIKVFDKAHDKDPDPEKRTGCSFDDFIALKGKKNIGEGMDKIIARLADENTDLKGVIDIAHFNDEKKLGSGKEMVDKLTDLISIFQRPELDFSRNKAEGDDIIGDAYEYLMRKFATESGKSKGQFYTPAEVSRILANVVGISRCTDSSATVCDPACGSGSLLIRAIDAAPIPIMGYGQEKESTTAGLAKMNAVLHRKAEITIKSGNTFSNPQYLDKSDNSILERFDYIVANPPFSMKNWRDGLKEYGRFEGYGDTPPEKNGDYAWLMHILKTLKSNGKAAVILPHGVLFRGNAEATIREAIIKKHWIKGIISLPANLFYGTGIAACVLVIDKEGAANRQGIFMIDASRGYVKDGNKNRLRERDIYRIITTFNEQITTDPKYARFVPNDEIEKKNEYNLNITRYIDSTDPEDIQDIYAHIHGGIPAVDINSLSKYWDVFPSLKTELLTAISEKYYSLNVEHENIRQTIYKNAEFSEYGEKLDDAFAEWKTKEYPALSTLDEDVSAKELIVSLAEDILAEFEHLTLIDKYDVYQVLLAYWNEVMNDDVSLIISEPDGYANARATDNIEEEITSGKKKGEMKITGWEGRLIPKNIVIDAFFREEKNAIEEAENVATETESQLLDLIESADEESALADVAENGKVKVKDIEAKIAELTQHVETEETIELEVILMDLHLVNTKKRLEAYLVGHPLCKSAVNENGKITKSSIEYRLSVIRTEESVPEDLQDDVNQLKMALELSNKISEYNKIVKELYQALDEKCRARYETLTDEEIIDLLVNRKWFDSIFSGISDLYAAISHRLTNRIVELAERYESTLPELSTDTAEYETKVKSHLERMGFEW
ncbi:type I restriction-modification system, M subunit [[Clostridium] scindens ATCC 35704]|uniref:site-specific DNA-methyltransferase (adenine-specific) n=1 Tax=Clostridium scindens (strain ATCC 35704 / DSM 5676 / VPI 13733 / 19) TaxID=411468 RepID=B0NJ52_CLOS5|nr:type I restriction-modification system subunit M [[Clostridium] scindens]EDS05382.1 type I restriction-modification system, M subunit [[Clostridium] scindens ATCC 35704]QBF75126.1 putative type I restriction enzymeP M protein [[Clostridium] scindens ATCC 35704]QRO38286.1 type I restriction-modification system subunit M [[Clostridium] scindens]BDF16155.1 type I restriction-modification system subunit M [[Clostridium] scindens]BDF19852.1 type I restriction-modification system subunit M [[Clos